MTTYNLTPSQAKSYAAAVAKQAPGSAEAKRAAAQVSGSTSSGSTSSSSTAVPSLKERSIAAAKTGSSTPTTTSTKTSASNSVAPASLTSTVNKVNTAQPNPTTVNATPYTGNSIVDALAQAGMASDFASRAKLAATAGISNYTGTAQQNTQLLQKYRQGLLNAQSSGTPAPTEGAGTAVTSPYLPAQPEDTSYVDSVLADDKGYQQLLQDQKDFNNVENQRTSLVDEYKQMIEDSGIEGINTDLINTKNIIEGTEDDIRNEITKAGGFATDSQVLALSNARNKSLIKNYNNLLDTKQMIMENVNTMIGLAEKDQANAVSIATQKFNIDSQIVDYAQKMQTNAQNQYQKIIDQVGYDGLYKSTGGNPYYTNLIEKTLGLGSGQLATLASQPNYETLSKQAEYQGQLLQNQKLTQELKAGPKLNTQIVDVNGKKVLVNSDTGDVIKEITTGAETTQPLIQAQDQATIETIDALKNHNGINIAVGPNAFARWTPFKADTWTGDKQDFIAGVEQLTSQLSLDSLIQAKAKGATFGALSEGEMRILSATASKINTWRHTDKNGNVNYYNTSEANFKKELDKIGNFAKYDYILKGGNPEAVGVTLMPNGKYIAVNSDGSYVELN